MSAMFQRDWPSGSRELGAIMAAELLHSADTHCRVHHEAVCARLFGPSDANFKFAGIPFELCRVMNLLSLSRTVDAGPQGPFARRCPEQYLLEHEFVPRRDDKLGVLETRHLVSHLKGLPVAEFNSARAAIWSEAPVKAPLRFLRHFVRADSTPDSVVVP